MTAVIMRPAFVRSPPVGVLTSFARRTPSADRLRGHLCRTARPPSGRPSVPAASTVRWMLASGLARRLGYVAAGLAMLVWPKAEPGEPASASARRQGEPALVTAEG